MKKILLATLLAARFSTAYANNEPLKSAHLLAPEYQDLSALKAFEGADAIINALSQDDYQTQRAKLQKLNSEKFKADLASQPQASGKLTVPQVGDQPAVDLYLFEPSQKQVNSPVIYFIHGGGYILGNALQKNKSLVELANATGAVVVSLEYRQASDAPFPADINDAYHGLSYLFDNAEKLGFDKKKIVLMGESAGGGLTARLALKTRDLGKYQPAGQVLIYPMLDYRTGTDKSPYQNPYAGEFVWKPAFNRLGWNLLKADQQISEENLPYYSAAMAKKLAGLPPTYLMVGSLDLFVNEDIDYANRLVQAGVPTDLVVINGVYHTFESINPQSPQTQHYKTSRNAAIQRMFEAVK